jgi:chromosome segregation ATPase
MRVTLKNFVTYTSAEFYPGPNMNLVIGPNGSGKSTIVCAICLGLGYSANVLGRATAVGDFVQHGKDSAEIEIELALTANKSMIVKRKIKKDKNSSVFYVDGISDFDLLMVGKQDSLSKVQEHMKAFNIQIDNLWYVDLDRSDIVNFFRKIASLRLLNFRQLNCFTKLNVPLAENRW